MYAIAAITGKVGGALARSRGLCTAAKRTPNLI